VPDAKVLPDWIARRRETLRPVFACARTNAGLDAASVLVGCSPRAAAPRAARQPYRRDRHDFTWPLNPKETPMSTETMGPQLRLRDAQ
jgi:hypothetical protein